MKFRTEIETARCIPIEPQSHILMMGSCFTPNIGTQLAIDGFNVNVNPTGVLYNPASIAGMIERSARRRPYTEKDLITDDDGTFHLLDFPNNMQGTDIDGLLTRANTLMDALSDSLEKADILIVTFGTAWVFDLNETGVTVGNCHKLPASFFTRRRLTPDEIVNLWKPVISTGRRVIFTISPIRHLADGLHGNCVSKSTLQLAVDTLVNYGAEYFPAFEIMMDDLRDYRFYAADMKHPSETAVEYIYEIFKSRYFSKPTEIFVAKNRKQYIHSQHRRLL
ncbi:MAG: GSCFA domain-containing protein [Muribaculaceae bacterium]|nr:GSCFA domain-containing protein [Muribaculaceae bacterium]